MNRLTWLTFFAFLLIGPLARTHAINAPAPAPPKLGTPSPLRLFLDQWTPTQPRRRAYSLDFLRTSDDQTVKVTLREAILIGLENNPGIVVDRLEPFRAAEDTLKEKSIFDPTLTLEFNKDFAVEPSGSRQSAFSSITRLTRNRNWNLSLKKLFRTGTQLELSLLNNELVTTFPTQALRPAFRPSLGFSLTQPLLRDFGLGITTINVRVAENREGASLFDYKARLAQLIQRISEAYRNVVFTKQNLKVRRKGVDLAQALLDQAEAKVQAGVLPPVAVTEAKAERARREELLITAQNDLQIARTNLRLTLNLNPQKTFMPRRIEPIETPSVQPIQLKRLESLHSALSKRPEIQSANLNVENEALELRLAENELLPRLDFKVGANLIGISGDLRKFENKFQGGYSKSFDRLFSGDFNNYQIGITLQIPLGNGEARSSFSRARIELEQAKARLRDLVSQITLEVETALGDVRANFKRTRAARLARESAEENLRAQERRYEVGLVTLTDLIDFQTRLLEAQETELRAATDYNNSLSRLKLAEGTLLDYYNINIEGPKKEPDPWWARF